MYLYQYISIHIYVFSMHKKSRFYFLAVKLPQRCWNFCPSNKKKVEASYCRLLFLLSRMQQRSSACGRRVWPLRWELEDSIKLVPDQRNDVSRPEQQGWPESTEIIAGTGYNPFHTGLQAGTRYSSHSGRYQNGFYNYGIQNINFSRAEWIGICEGKTTVKKIKG
jgi:hypothetical protein